MSAEQRTMPDTIRNVERVAEMFEEQLRWTADRRFSAVDVTGTVEATLDGERRLVGLEIGEGLLRLGARTVEQRINDALRNAESLAIETMSSRLEQFTVSLVEFTEQMTETVQTDIDLLVQLLGISPQR